MSEENNPIDGFMGQSMKREEISPRKESSGGGGGQDSSRKRKYDSDNHRSGHSNNGSNKRSNMSSSSRGDRGEHRGGDEEEEVYLKMMIPAPVAGGVIGRGGDKIGQIQKEAQVRMKMSKNNEHYPGTQERVCLIIGSVKSVLKAHAMVVERMQEKDEKLSHRDSDLQDRVNQIKILIPNTTAGFLIGKSGGTIKQIKDDSGAHVQISSKQTDLPERVVTIEGDSDRRNKALSMIVRKIAEDPQHSSEPTLSYSSLSSGIGGSSGSSGGSNMSGNVGAASAYDHYGVAGIQSNQVAAVAALQNATQKLDMNAAAYYMSGLNNLALLIINCGGSYQMTAENLKLSLRNAGYSSQASAEILEAITIMLNYGLITKNSPAALLAANPSLANLINLGQVGLANISSALAASIGATGGGGNPMAAMTAASGGQGVVSSHGGPSPQHQQQYYQNGSGSVAGSGIGKRR